MKERARRQEEAEAARQAELAARRARLEDVKRAAADREEVRPLVNPTYR